MNNDYKWVSLSGDISLTLLKSDKVWHPTKYAEILISILEKNFKTSDLKGTKLLDMGCGSGVLSVAAAKLGAEVYVSDLNQEALDATKQVATLNDVKINDYFLMDRFESFPKSYQGFFDTIICNTPSLPDETDKVLRERNNAIEWNQSGKDARLVLSSLIYNSKKYLKNSGIGSLLITASDLQDWDKTQTELVEIWGKENYQIKHSELLKLTPHYNPYLEYWTEKKCLKKEYKNQYSYTLRVIEAYNKSR